MDLEVEEAKLRCHWGEEVELHDLPKLCSSVTQVPGTSYPRLNSMENLKTAEFASENIIVMYMSICHFHQSSTSQSRISFSIQSVVTE